MALGSNNTKLQMKVKDKDAKALFGIRLEEGSTGLDSDIAQLYGAFTYSPTYTVYSIHHLFSATTNMSAQQWKIDILEAEV